MKRVLFVTNGHGEMAIAARIARELPPEIDADHLALVGAHASGERLRDAGPRRAMPSGGLVAMGNVRNIIRDVAGGLAGHTLAQLKFLGGVRGTYDAAVAVGDVYALLMARRARARATVFVGTAKSVYVAPYGAFEERAIRAAQSAFVRDEATAARLRDRGIAARAANAIVDLYEPIDAGLRDAYAPYFAVFPGSRDLAYADAVELCAIVRELARVRPQTGAALSIAPGLEPQRFARMLAAHGWIVRADGDERRPFSLLEGDREIVRAWRGPLGGMLHDADAVLGQAGTANEAAAALGIPVIALARGKGAWYRRRQAGLLGDALAIVDGAPGNAAQQIAALLDDAARLERMRAAGRARMGPPGAAREIAAEIARVCG